jgi:hypothetical protein
MLEHTAQRAGCPLIAWMPRNRNPARLGGVSKLAVAPLRADQKPPIVLDHADHVSHLHQPRFYRVGTPPELAPTTVTCRRLTGSASAASEEPKAMSESAACAC